MSLGPYLLPKWPQCYVTGKDITIEQSKEIIRRTDGFFREKCSGNDKKYEKRVRRTIGMPVAPGIFEPRELWLEYYNKVEGWMEKWGGLDLIYLTNSWVSTCFYQGPHGWCHPDGKIGFIDNIGKWPDIEDVHSDLVKIADAFPFLEMGITLWSCESCEKGMKEDKGPVVSFSVLGGLATMVETYDWDVHAGHDIPVRRSNYVDRTTHTDDSYEHGLPFEWFKEWAKKFKE